MADRQVTFPCSVNSFPFYPAISDSRSVDAIPNQGHTAYLDYLLYWQGKIPYQCKCLFNDNVTFQFKTQADSTNSRLYVYNSRYDAAKNHHVPNAAVSAFTTPLQSGSEYFGKQSPTYDIYTDPISGGTQQLSTYMWTFQFGAYLNYLTDSGIYFVVFDNVNDAGVHQLWYSEPILLMGVDAKQTFPTTLIFEGDNNTNVGAGDVPPIVSNWQFSASRKVQFHTRAEADILDWDTKGVFTGYLQENYNQLVTYNQNWDIWTLNVGSIDNGIPPAFFKIIQQFLLLDNTAINNFYYIYDFGEGSGSPNTAWKIKKDRSNLLYSGTLAIRGKFSNGFYAQYGSGRYHAAGFDKHFN